MRRRRWWRIIRNTIVLLGLAAVIGWAIGFQRAYGTWPGLDVKDRINWCGHVYRIAVTDLTAAEVNSPDPTHPVQIMFSYPPHFPRRDVLAIPPSDPNACPGALYIHSASDRYTKYLPAGAG